LGAFVGDWAKIIGFLRSDRSPVTAQNAHYASAGRVRCDVLRPLLAVIFYLRQISVAGSPQCYLYLEVGGTLLSFCYAANALVRFRGTHDRTALILAFGFVLSGIIETVGSFGLNGSLISGALALSGNSHRLDGEPHAACRTIARRHRRRALHANRAQPSKELAAGLLVVALAAYMTSAAFLAAPAAPRRACANLLSRPWDLLPRCAIPDRRGLFSPAAQERQRPRRTPPASSITLSLSSLRSMLSACIGGIFTAAFRWPVFLAELSKTCSYVVMLSGALLDQARLFEQVRSMAVTDPLTGLSNYRRLISVLEAELDRSRRTQRPFSVVLFDMDGLKIINDHTDI